MLCQMLWLQSVTQKKGLRILFKVQGLGSSRVLGLGFRVGPTGVGTEKTKRAGSGRTLLMV